MKTIGLFSFYKLVVLVLCLGMTSISFAQGELCDMAIEIECGERDGNNDTGMFSTDQYCGTSANLTGPEVAFALVPPTTQIYTFELDVFGAGQDLDMFLLDDNCDAGDCIANSDGATNDPDIMSATLMQGETYFLIIDGDGGSISEFLLDVTCTEIFQCEFEDIECDQFISSDNDTGSMSINSYCNGTNTNLTGPEKVFRFVAPLSQTYTFLLENFSGDLDMFLVEDSCDPDDCIATSDSGTSTPFDIITVFLDAGDEYFLIIDGDGGTISDFDLTIECGASCEADFSWEDDCGKVTFTNNSTGDNLSYNWTIDGVTYTDVNPCVQFNANGTYTVVLVVNSPNCEDTFESEIEVELCPDELFCDCCPEGAQFNFEGEVPGPLSTFFQAPWLATYGTPTYIAEGCDNPNSPISIQVQGPTFGFQGSAVSHSINGVGGPSLVFQKDTTYCISYCYRINEVAPSPNSGSIKMRATNTVLSDGNCSSQCTVIDVSPSVTVSDGWQTHQFLWTSDDDYFEYVFSTDATGVLDGIIDMNIDNVCVSAYAKSCKASFAFADDGCGNVEFTSTSCGDNITESWVINGVTSTGPFVSFSGPGPLNVTLTIVGADGCSDTVNDVVNVSAVTPLILTCPPGESVLIPLVNGECLHTYIVPAATTNVASNIVCQYNGSIVNTGDVLMLPPGNHLFSCIATDACEQMADCSWNVFVECEEENGCPIDGTCDLISAVNLGTGVDAFGNVIPSGTGQVDPFWKVINNAPVASSCTNAFLPTLNGTPYVINYVFPNTTAWINLPGAGIIAPYDIGNGGVFGCNNLRNGNGEFVPYIFQRTFCVCEEDEFTLNVSYEGDDQLVLELYDLNRNSAIATGNQYVYASAPVNFTYTGVLPAGSYAIRAYLANTGNTVLGFAMNGGINSTTGKNTIIEQGECCAPQSVHVLKILDNDCSSDVSSGDQVGQGWNFNLRNTTGGIVQSGTTDINGEIIFNNVDPGNYVLEEVTMTGWTPVSPPGGTTNITVSSTGFNSWTFYNCPFIDVDCDSLMVMARPYDFPCIDSSIIQGVPCATIFDPVCGCDGMTYGNACEANEAGVTTFNAGECNPNNIPNTDDYCCYTFDLKNNWGSDIVKVEVELLTKDWIFNQVKIDPSLMFGNAPVLNDEFDVVPNGGNQIPMGTTIDAIKSCFAPAVQNATSPQIVEFRWIQSVNEMDSFIVCRDTITLECESPPIDSCFVVEEDFISCSNPNDPSHYEYCFTITNNSGFDVGKITLEDLPAGFSFLNNCTASKTIVTMPNPLLNGATSQQMCVGIKSSIPIISPQEICFKMGLISTDGDECCHSAVEICKIIDPCCDPCLDNMIIAMPLDTMDECCYSIDIAASCQKGYFTRIEAEVITPGVCFGSHVMGASYAGFWNVVSSPTSISMTPITGNLDQVYYQDLFSFCLDKLNDPSQDMPQVKFNWYAIDPVSGQEIVACMDTITTACRAPDENLCAEITDQDLVCVPDSSKYRYTFTVTNWSNPGFTADKLHLTVENDPANYEAFPTGPIIPLTPPLQYGQSRTISTCIVGTPFPPAYSDFVFSYRLQNMATGDCCFESVMDTIVIPPCEPDSSCCDIDEDLFCDYFDILLAYDETDCKLSWDMSNLDSCDVVRFTFEDGSSITPDIGELVCREFLQSGNEEVCVTIERWDNTQNLLLPCFMKDTCFTVEVVCDPPMEMCGTCPTGSTKVETIINGDFENNTVGFTSDYVVGPPSLSAGEFDVRSSGSLFNPSWQAVDHTTNLPAGNFLVADGPFAGAIWRQTVAITPGETYNFCAWFNNLVVPSNVDSGTPMIEVRVNSVLIGTPLPLPQLPDQWENYTATWVGVGSTATIEIFNVSPNGFGDVAVDDISFFTCGETMNTCCQDEDAFCDLVDLGWQVTVTGCEVKVQATQFDTCHWMWNVSPDWGDGSILLPTVSPANGCWTHTYSASGVYNICAIIFEGDSLGNECWSKQLCQEVEVDCGPCEKTSPCIEVSDVQLKEVICEVNDCYSNPFCAPWLTMLMTQSNNNGCQPLVDYYRFDKALWNGQSVIIGFVAGAPDGGGEDIFLCDGTLIQSCRAAVGIVCNPDAGIDINSDLTNYFNIWNCGDMLQQAGADCFTTNSCVNYCATITNNTDPQIPVSILELNQVTTGNISVAPDPILLSPPLMPGQNTVINFQICSALNPGDSIKIDMGLPSNLDTLCCILRDTLCLAIPDCPTTCDTLLDPCDLVSLDLNPDPIDIAECCFIGSADNQYCDDYFKGIKVDVQLPATISQVQALNGWTINQLNPTQAEFYPPSSFVPLGMQDVFKICNDNDGSSFTVNVTWLVADSLGNCIEVCPESFDRQCSGVPGGCVEIVQDSIDCENDIYCFRVVNTTSPEIIIKSVEFIQVSPNGATLTPNPYSINPLMSGDTSEWVCVDYTTVNNDDICFLLVGHEADLPAGEPITWCCVDSVKYFIEVDSLCPPGCGPASMACEDISVDLVSDPVTGDLCCFEGTIENNYCADYFKGVKITTTNTSNISQVQALNGWVINQLNNMEAELYPPTANIPLGQLKVFSVCNNTNVNPFDIKVSWLVADSLGNCIEVCDETFDLTCQDSISTGCISVVQDSIDCNNNMYCFKIINETSPGFTIRSVDLISILPSGASVNPNPVGIPPLAVGMTSDWICFSYSGVEVGDDLCYFTVAHDVDVTQGNFPTQCCVTDEMTCITIPECPQPSLECVQILEDSIDCENGKYSFKIRNNTNPAFSINSLNLINVQPPSAGFLNTPIAIPTLNQGDVSDWITVDYFGNPSDTVCFNIVVHLQDITNGEEPTWCCSTFESHCFVIEDCGVSCCQDQNVFDNLIDIGFDTTTVRCDLNIVASQFDSCHWIDIGGIDWGDGSIGPDTLTLANQMLMHTYSSSGNYEVCVTVFEGQDELSKCWEETICFDVEVTCNEPMAPCENTALVIPNGLTPNNDGLNDRLMIQDDSQCSAIQLNIYNRWGQEVYRSKDYKNDWSGQSNINEDLPSGTYFIVAGYLDSEEAPIKTFIDLRR